MNQNYRADVAMSQWKRRPNVRYTVGEEIEPSNQPKARIEQYAGEVANAAGFQVGGSIAALLRRLSGRLHYESLESWESEDTGSIIVHGQSDFDIYLPEYTSPLRDRFTVAHELGHYFLHSLWGKKPIVAFRKGSSRIEWEANWFAAALLMPSEEFLKEVRRGASMATVAARFGVSLDAANVRKSSLGA